MIWRLPLRIYPVSTPNLSKQCYLSRLDHVLDCYPEFYANKFNFDILGRFTAESSPVKMNCFLYIHLVGFSNWCFDLCSLIGRNWTNQFENPLKQRRTLPWQSSPSSSTWHLKENSFPISNIPIPASQNNRSTTSNSMRTNAFNWGRFFKLML